MQTEKPAAPPTGTLSPADLWTLVASMVQVPLSTLLHLHDNATDLVGVLQRVRAGALNTGAAVDGSWMLALTGADLSGALGRWVKWVSPLTVDVCSVAGEPVTGVLRAVAGVGAGAFCVVQRAGLAELVAPGPLVAPSRVTTDATGAAVAVGLGDTVAGEVIAPSSAGRLGVWVGPASGPTGAAVSGLASLDWAGDIVSTGVVTTGWLTSFNAMVAPVGFLNFRLVPGAGVVRRVTARVSNFAGVGTIAFRLLNNAAIVHTLPGFVGDGLFSDPTVIALALGDGLDLEVETNLGLGDTATVTASILVEYS